MALAPTPFVWGRGGRRMTPEEIAREREIADKLGMQAGDTSPVGHWTQGAARVVNALGGVLADRRAKAATELNAAEDKTALTGLLGLLGGGSTVSPTTANVASALVPSSGGMPAQTAMVEGQPPIPGLQRAPSVLPASFLAAVDRTEGAGGYDTLFGHAQKGKFAGTDISAMPIRDVIAFTDPSGPYAQSVKSQIGRVATPVGRYQVVGTTLRNAVAELGLDPNMPFDATTQDMVAKHLATRRIANAGSLPQKISALRSEWEGFKGVPDDQMAQIVADLEGGAAMSAQPGAAATANVPMSGAAAAYVDPMVSAQPAMPVSAQPALPEPAASGGIMDAIATPMSADYFPPAPSAPQAGAIDPAVIEALSSPYASPQTKQVASMLLERTMTQQQQAQERAMQEQQRAQEIQQRQAFLQANGLDPSIAMVDEAFSEAAKAPFAAPSTSTVGSVVIDNRTGQPIFEGQPEATTGMRDYQAYAQFEQSQGRVPLGPLEYEQAVRRSGAPQTNVNVGGEKFDEQFGSLDAKTLTEVGNAGMSAQRNLGRINQLESLLAEAPSGFSALLAQRAGEFGIRTDGLDTLQAAQALINSLVPEQRPPGSGPMSDADLELFKQSLPRIINQPEGNRRIIETMRGVAQYDAQGAQILQRLRNEEITRAEAFQLLQSRVNPLAEFKAPAAEAENPLPPQTQPNKAKTGVTWEFLD